MMMLEPKINDLKNSINENNFNVKFRLFEIGERLTSFSSEELTSQLEIARHEMEKSDKKLRELKGMVGGSDVKSLNELEKDYTEVYKVLEGRVGGGGGRGDGLRPKSEGAIEKVVGIEEVSLRPNSTSSIIHSMFEGISPIKSPKVESRSSDFGHTFRIKKSAVMATTAATGTTATDTATSQNKEIKYPRLSQFKQKRTPFQFPVQSQIQQTPFIPITRLDIDEDPFSSDSERVDTLPIVKPSQGEEVEEVVLEGAKEKYEQVERAAEEEADAPEQPTREIELHHNPQSQRHNHPISIKNVLHNLSTNIDNLSKDEIQQKLQNCLFLLENENENGPIEGEFKQFTPKSTSQSSQSTLYSPSSSELVNKLKSRIDFLTQHSESLKQQINELQKSTSNSPSNIDPDQITLLQEVFIRKYDAERLRNTRSDLKFIISYQTRELQMYKQASRKRLEILHNTGAIQIHDTTILESDHELDERVYNQIHQPGANLHHPRSHPHSSPPSLLSVSLAILSAIRIRNRLYSSRRKLDDLRLKVKQVMN